MDYTPFDKPHTIWSSQGESRFSYDASEKLVKRTDKKAGGDMVTYYVGGHEAIYQPDGSSEIKRYIRDIAIHTIKSSGSQSLHYVFNDHLGSGSVITDANGNVVETASFDAFGKRRDAKLWGGYVDPFSHLPNLQALLNITQKGYTGHIQVDHASIIHMGGRIYDPDLGRFIQADPIVQDPRDAQSLNRYSYVYNNPLSYTDPTGYAADCKSKECPATVYQQEQDTAKAEKTRGSSKAQDVNKGNQSADLQNAAKVASGQTQSQTQSGGLQEDIKRQAEQGMRSAVNDAGVTDSYEGSVNAKWGGVVRDEQGNPTKIGVSCDITCRKNAADFSKFTSDDIAISVMVTGFRASQRETAELLSYQFSAIAVGGYATTRLAITFINFAKLPTPVRNSCISLVAECISVMNSAKPGWSPSLREAESIYRRHQMLPRMRTHHGAGKPKYPVDSSGNPIIFRDIP